MIDRASTWKQQQLTLDSMIYSNKEKAKIQIHDLIVLISKDMKPQPVIAANTDVLIAWELRNRTLLPIEVCSNLLIQFNNK